MEQELTPEQASLRLLEAHKKWWQALIGKRFDEASLASSDVLWYAARLASVTHKLYEAQRASIKAESQRSDRTGEPSKEGY